jgi:hypothetical protein
MSSPAGECVDVSKYMDRAVEKSLRIDRVVVDNFGFYVDSV